MSEYNMKSFALILSMISFTGCLDWGETCKNELLQEILSPSHKKKAIVFRRTGTLTDDSMQVSLVAAKDKLSNEGGNLFVTDSKRGIDASMMHLTWLHEDTLLIRYSKDLRTFAQETTFQKTTIQYEVF
jgi:hypothetical protein